MLEEETAGSGAYGAQARVAKRLDVTAAYVSLVLRGKRGASRDAVQKAMAATGVDFSFFHDATLVDPHCRDFVRKPEPHVEPVIDDTVAWLELEEHGRIDWYRQRGLTDRQVQAARVTPWRGPPTPRDYERVLEAMLLGPEAMEGREPPQMTRAREAHERSGAPTRGKRWLPDPNE